MKSHNQQVYIKLFLLVVVTVILLTIVYTVIKKLYFIYVEQIETKTAQQNAWLLSNYNQKYSISDSLKILCSQLPPNSIYQNHCKNKTLQWLNAYKNDGNYSQCIRSLPFGDSELWDNPEYEKYNNCTAYALQDPKSNRQRKPVLGDQSEKYKMIPLCDANFTSSELIKRALADYPTLKHLPVNIEHEHEPVAPCGYYKVALVADFGNDLKGRLLAKNGYNSVVNKRGFGFHWYRQDANGLWSHKMGSAPPSFKDASGNYILHPRFADHDYTRKGVYPLNDNYTEIIAYFYAKAPKNFSDKLFQMYEKNQLL